MNGMDGMNRMGTNLCSATVFLVAAMSASLPAEPPSYRKFRVEEDQGSVLACHPIAEEKKPLWAEGVSQDGAQEWKKVRQPYFEGPITYVRAPKDSSEPFYSHNHQPSITWLPNGDLLAIWYSTNDEKGTELTVLASRFRNGGKEWDASSEFFKAENRNMHGSNIFHDGEGTIFHFNGMGPEGGRGWEKLALLMRKSADNGVTWSEPTAINSAYRKRNQVISGTRKTKDGVLIQPCDAVPGSEGGTALHLSEDGGETWTDPGAEQAVPDFRPGAVGKGTIAGIHAGVVELSNGRLMALGRGNAIEDKMPMSLSSDLGGTWTYSASPFPPIGSGQRLTLLRLQEGPLLLISFTNPDCRTPREGGMEFNRANGSTVTGHGIFAAISEDEGKTWPIRKLITPGAGEFDGGGWTRRFTATPDNAEHAGYLASTQSPDGTVHLISSALHYRFNLAWLREPAKSR
jgi:sulfatase modifying factor 1